MKINRELSASNITSVSDSVKRDLSVAEQDLFDCAVGSPFAPDALLGDKAGTASLLRQQAYAIGKNALYFHDLQRSMSGDSVHPYELLSSDAKTASEVVKRDFEFAEKSAYNMARHCSRAPMYARLSSGRAGVISSRHCKNACCPVCARWRASNRRSKALLLNECILSSDDFKGFKDAFATFSTENLYCYYAPEGYDVLSLALRLLTGDFRKNAFNVNPRVRMLFKHAIISPEVTYNLTGSKWFGTFNLHFHAFCRCPASAFSNSSSRSTALVLPSVPLFRSEWIRAVKTACELLSTDFSLVKHSSGVYDYMVDWCKENLSSMSDPFDGLSPYDYRRYIPVVRGKEYLNVSIERVSGRADGSSGLIETLSYTVKPASFASIDAHTRIPAHIKFSSLCPEFMQLQAILYFCTCEMFYGKRLVRYRGCWRSFAHELGLSDSDDELSLQHIDLDKQSAYIFQVVYPSPDSDSVLHVKEFGESAVAFLKKYLADNFKRVTGFDAISYKKRIEFRLSGSYYEDSDFFSDAQLQYFVNDGRITSMECNYYRLAHDILIDSGDVLRNVRKVSGPAFSYYKTAHRLKRSGRLRVAPDAPADSRAPDDGVKVVDVSTPFDE